jgi:outer membrane protein assembly factor BamB
VTPCDQNIVTPLQAGNLLVVSSLDRGTLGIRVSRVGASWVPEIAWETAEVSMYMSSPVLVKGKVLGLSHKKRGQFFALDPATGAVAWKGEGGQGENAAFVVAQGVVLALQGDGMLLVLPQEGPSFSPLKSYRIAESQTFAHPVPTELGILVKDDVGLSLYGWGGQTSRRS